MTSTIDGSLIGVGTIPGNRLAPNAAIDRTKLAQRPNVIKRLSPFDWRVWDTGAALGAAGNDDLGIVPGTFGADVYTVQAGDLKSAGATTRRAIVHIAIPENYQDGETLTIRLRAGMVTNVADNACTIDLEAYEVGDGVAGGSPTDLCVTAAQDMNSETPADFDFAITPDNLVAGDILEVRVSITCNDAATGTAVTPVLYKSALLYDALG